MIIYNNDLCLQLHIMKYFPIFKPFFVMYEVDPYRELLNDFET